MVSEKNPVVARMRRGPAVESVHRGAWVVAATDGTVRTSNSDPDQAVFCRSATKSFQALPLLTSGAADAFGFDEGDVALAMASHSGEAMHVERVLASLRRLSLTEDDLLCGPQRPCATWADQTERRATNNCSGKHVGFLAVARHLDTDPADYLNPDGAVQLAVLGAVRRILGTDDDFRVGIDGCSAPTFHMPLRLLARGIARVAGSDGLDADLHSACRRMVAAAAAHPHLIGGSRDRFDSDLISATGGRLLAKVGAEAVFVVGVVDAGIGYAVKIDDGTGRAIAPLVIDLLVANGHLSDAQRAALAHWDQRERRNWDGLEVGHVEISTDTADRRKCGAP